MNNYIQEGDTLTVKAPYAVSGGGGMKIGLMFCIAAVDAAAGDIIEAATRGVFDLVKDASVFTNAPGDGVAVYWDDTAKKATSTVGSNLKIGVAVCLQTDGNYAPGPISSDATVRVRLNGSF